MQTTTTVGLDIAKSVFQVHGIDADGNVVVRRQLNDAMFWRSFRNDIRTMRLTRKRFAKPSPGETCASCRPRPLNSKAA
jgi:hypothetical protein